MLFIIVEALLNGAINIIAPVAVDECALYSANPKVVLPLASEPLLGDVNTVLVPFILCENPVYVPDSLASGIVPVVN